MWTKIEKYDENITLVLGSTIEECELSPFAGKPFILER